MRNILHIVRVWYREPIVNSSFCLFYSTQSLHCCILCFTTWVLRVTLIGIQAWQKYIEYQTCHKCVSEVLWHMCHWNDDISVCHPWNWCSYHYQEYSKAYGANRLRYVLWPRQSANGISNSPWDINNTLRLTLGMQILGKYIKCLGLGQLSKFNALPGGNNDILLQLTTVKICFA